MSNVLGKSETKSLNKSDTKNLAAEEKKKLGVSETRGKKMKYSYNVNDPENALVMKLKDGEVALIVANKGMALGILMRRQTMWQE